MRRTTITLLIIMGALTLPTVAIAGGWTVVKKKSTSGQYAATVADATITRPHRIAVEFIHGTGDVAWVCDSGVSVAEWSKQYGAGLHQLAHVSGKDSCTITAEVSGQGHITVEILKG